MLNAQTHEFRECLQSSDRPIYIYVVGLSRVLFAPKCDFMTAKSYVEQSPKRFHFFVRPFVRAVFHRTVGIPYNECVVCGLSRPGGHSGKMNLPEIGFCFGFLQPEHIYAEFVENAYLWASVRHNSTLRKCCECCSVFFSYTNRERVCRLSFSFPSPPLCTRTDTHPP